MRARHSAVDAQAFNMPVYSLTLAAASAKSSFAGFFTAPATLPVVISPCISSIVARKHAETLAMV